MKVFNGDEEVTMNDIYERVNKARRPLSPSPFQPPVNISTMPNWPKWALDITNVLVDYRGKNNDLFLDKAKRIIELTVEGYDGCRPRYNDRHSIASAISKAFDGDFSEMEKYRYRTPNDAYDKKMSSVADDFINYKKSPGLKPATLG